jgi:hypothetical protein
MEADRGCNAVTDLTDRQILDDVLKSLKDAAQDVDERRTPLDGRVRLLQPLTTKTFRKPIFPDAAE